ncbi:hypothetical protein F5Y18DRAFT_139614 [Xylariaceae sp. FL1019]|nr:hypothetical protein F5Y18DRAFT_139614 [Xylariaceae sp. FL1019]
MLRGLLLGAVLYSALGQASTGSAVTTTSTVDCSANYGSSKPTDVPTISTTTVISSLATAAPVTVPLGYTRVTADAVTTTKHTSTSVDVIIATVTSGTFQAYATELTTLAATATWSVTVCTNDVTPTTVTTFTGVYTPLPGQPSQSSGGPGSYITEVVCTTSIISSIQLFPTVTASTTATIVTTPTVTITDITASTVSTVTYATVTTWSTTVTSLLVSYTPATTVTTISTACEPTATVTLDARCDPDNIVTSIDGLGLVSGNYATNTSVTYTSKEPFASDMSLCCQACLDNEGCGASMSGESGYCGLYYVSDAHADPVCNDFVFSFQTQTGYYPGQGLRVQSGCGSIELESNS